MKLRNATEEDLIDAISDNQIEAWLKIAPHVAPDDLPTNCYDQFGITGVITGVPYMMMQPLWDGDPRLTHADVEDILNWYRQHRLPLMWFITPHNPADNLPRILLDLGLEEASMKVPGMMIDLKNQIHSTLERLEKQHTIKPATPDDATEITDIMLSAFEVSDHPEIRERMARFFSATLDYSPSFHVVAEVDDEIVGCASLLYAAGVAGIYNVSVLEKYRRRNIATSMMARLLLDAIDRGYQYSILHSSERGKQVYERLGYQTKFIYRRFLLRPAAVGFDG